MIQVNFQGKVKRVFKCQKCNDKTVKEENILDLPLSFPEDQRRPASFLSAQDMLLQFFTPATFTKENQLSCKICHSLQDHTCTPAIQKPSPKYLILTFTRFSYNSRRRGVDKSREKTDVPETLFLPLGGESQEEYKLVAVVYHAGYTGDVGHYYAIAKRPATEATSTERWFKLDDTLVTETCRPSTSDAAHVMFYEKLHSEY